MNYRVKVIPEKCIGCGACVVVSENFEMQGEKATAKKEISDMESNNEAAEICPTLAILVEKAE